MVISLSNLVAMGKIWNNSLIKVRPVGLINTNENNKYYVIYWSGLLLYEGSKALYFMLM